MATLKLSLESSDEQIYAALNRRDSLAREAEAIVATKIINDLVSSRSTDRLNKAIAACAMYQDKTQVLSLIKRLHALFWGMNDKMVINGPCLVKVQKKSYVTDSDLDPAIWQKASASWQEFRKRTALVTILDPTIGSRLRFPAAKRQPIVTLEQLLEKINLCVDLDAKAKQALAEQAIRLAGK